MAEKKKIGRLKMSSDLRKTLIDLEADIKQAFKEIAVFDRLGMDSSEPKKELENAELVRKTLLKYFG